MTSRQAYFSAMYSAAEDPYGLRNRWYEARKRAVLLSALPAPRYAHAYEPGCGAGELTAALAERCDHLLASDFEPAAVAVAQRRTARFRHVRVVQHSLPADWPTPASVAAGPSTGPFDLIVLSELGYFLDAIEMAAVADGCRASLAPGGTLVACDWRPEFPQRVLPTAIVHAILGELGLACLVDHEEQDFVLRVWCRDGRSVADREGITSGQAPAAPVAPATPTASSSASSSRTQRHKRAMRAVSIVTASCTGKPVAHRNASA